MRSVLALATAACALSAVATEAVGVYSHRMNPRRHPDEARRVVKPPSWESFGGKMQFIALRGLSKNALERYVDKDRLGDVVWPPLGEIFAKDIAAKVAELKKRNLWLFDPWCWVPGSGEGETPWRQYYPTQEMLDLFTRELGDHWLGMDNGEQDGRYVGGYARGQTPFGKPDRYEQYLNFQRHFERMDEILGNRMATLVSLANGHYFLRENCYTLIGAETGQALPNAQLYYSWIRGAGKQYGVPWFGNVSVFNRWGWKAYPQKPSDSPDKGPSPVNGTSLALLKKLMYAQIFYNSLAVGFESSLYWSGSYTKDGQTELSPVGRIHKNAQNWYARHGDPGILHAPVAVMTDFYAGWCFPRHLYTGFSYLVWGALPYDLGDHLTEGVLDLIYPGYQDASYFKDERGFNADTPYGDIADCLLSDAPAWVLGQYPVVILTGRLRPSEELRDTLVAYVRAGGELCLTKGNERTLFPEGLAGIDPGKGRFTPIPGGDWGVEEKPQCAFPIVNRPGLPLAKPHPLTAPARAALDAVLRRQTAFATSAEPATNGLSIVSCRRGKGEWTVLIANNTWQARPFELHSRVGRILSCEELPTATDERAAVGFAPNVFTNFVAGADSAAAVAPGGIRIFRVKTDEGAAVKELPEAQPPRNFSNHVLALRGHDSIKEQVLKRPTFFRHYGGVMVDWTYLKRRDAREVRAERNWIDLQGLKVVVDMSSGFNLFPDLRLVKNDPRETARTDAAFDDVLEKMEILGAKNLVVALSRRPETNMTAEEADAAMKERLADFAARAAKRGVKLHLRQTRALGAHHLNPQKWPEFLANGQIAAAPSLAAMALAGERRRNHVEYMLRPGEPKYAASGNAPLYFLAAPAEDENRQLWSAHRPLASQTLIDPAALRSYLKILKNKNALLVYDAIYADADEEYRDARLLEDIR